MVNHWLHVVLELGVAIEEVIHVIIRAAVG
jgi:hypothetical protein